jgi:hypothetical protein
MKLKWGDEPETPYDQAIRLWYDKIEEFEEANPEPREKGYVLRLRAEAFAEVGAPTNPPRKTEAKPKSKAS